jgi:hypothetical protein
MSAPKETKTETETSTNTSSDDEIPMLTCDGCQGEIAFNSYRTYFTKSGVYCKCCVEKLPASEDET